VNDWLARLVSSEDAQAEVHLVLGVAAVVVAVLLEIYSVVVQNKPFDFPSFCTGLTVLLTGIGLASVGAGIQRKLQGPSNGP
jgi:hypothetical protein